MKRTYNILAIAIATAFSGAASTAVWAQTSSATPSATQSDPTTMTPSTNRSGTPEMAPSDTEQNRVSNTTNAPSTTPGGTDPSTQNRVGNPSGAQGSGAANTTDGSMTSGANATGAATSTQNQGSNTTTTPSTTSGGTDPSTQNRVGNPSGAQGSGAANTTDGSMNSSANATGAATSTGTTGAATRSPTVQDMQHPAVQTAQTDTGTSRSRMSNDGTTNTGTRWEDESTRSWIPYTSHGYAGLNLGLVDLNTRCDGPYSCNNPDLAGKVYVGGLISRVFGVEIGYVNANLLDDSRNGGVARAQGVNVSLVGNIPVYWFNVFAKVGTTYGWTNTSAGPASTVSTGKENGFGLSYGAGVGFDVTQRLQIVGEWDRHNFKFAEGREHADMYTVGVKWKFY